MNESRGTVAVRLLRGVAAVAAAAAVSVGGVVVAVVFALPSAAPSPSLAHYSSPVGAKAVVLVMCAAVGS
jgi:hypothetical protein